MEGYIYKITGRGTFISDAADINAGKKEELLRSLDKTVTELFYLSVSKEEIIERITALHDNNSERGNIKDDKDQ